LQAGWHGDTGMDYQAWQAKWNQAMERWAAPTKTTPPRCWPATKPKAPKGAA